MLSLPDRLRRALADHGRTLTILVVRLGALGDVVRTLPAVRLLRIGLPDARIFWVVDDRWNGLLAKHADLDGTVIVRRGAIASAARAARALPRLAARLAELRRDLRDVAASLVVDFHGNLRSGIVGALSGASVRIGYAGHQQREGNRWLTTHRVPSGPRRTSRLERNLRLVRALGLPTEPVPDAGLPRTIAGTRAARRVVRDCGAEGRPVAVLAPGASRRQAYKRPPADLLAAAADALVGRGITPLLVWGPGEEEDACRVAERARGTVKLAPPTDLSTLVALLRGAALCVAGDTGTLHLACGVGCPVVGIYGPTDPTVNAPWGVTHSVVRPAGRAYTGIKRVDRRAGGFDGIRADDVAEGIGRVVDALGSSAAASGRSPDALDAPGETVGREQ